MASSSRMKWSGKSRGGKFGYNFFIYITKIFGIRSAYCFLALVVVYFIPFAPKATRAIWKYNRKIHGYGVLRSCWELYMHYYVFGQTLIDKMAIRSGMADRYRFEFDNYKRFLEIIDGGQGVVLVGAHVGCWEAGSVFFGKYGKKINIVMYDAEYSKIKEVLNENDSEERDYKIIPVNQDGLTLMLQIKIALDQGEYVCFNGDRYVDADSSIVKEFMGREAGFPSGPFVIASRCRKPVAFYFAMREPGMKYRFIFNEPEIVPRMKPDELLGQYVSSLEENLKAYPRQWFNFYDFWNY